MRAGQEEVNNLSRELRYTQQTVAMELAGWQDMHERIGRKAIRELARGMVVAEKMRLEGMLRALRKLKEVPVGGSESIREDDSPDIREETAGFSILSPPIALAGLEMAGLEGDKDADLPVSTASAEAPPPPKTIIEDTIAARATVRGVSESSALGSLVPPQPRHDDAFGKDEGGGASRQAT